MLGEAKFFVDSVITTNRTYDELMSRLDGRYNDPLVMNNMLLHHLFFGEEFNKPKSTLRHWDQAVGRIRALSDRNLTVEDVLLYYRLYRFDKNLVDKVMDRHRSAKPAAEEISLEDAEIIMNRIVADEPHLKYVSTPKLIPTTATPLCNNPKSGAVSKTRNKYLSKNNDPCVLCGEKGHYYFTSTVYPTVSEKKQP